MQQEIKTHYSTSNAIVIIYPGYNGDVDGYDNKYEKLADFIVQKGIGSVVRSGNRPVQGREYKETVISELQEVIEYCLSNSVAICGIATPSIYLMGVSAGASAIAAVACRYSEIKKILLVAPSLDAGAEEMKNGLNNYKGELYIAIGEKDALIPVSMGSKLITFASCASVIRFVTVPDCDHQFRGEQNGKIFSKAPLWAFSEDTSFPDPEGGIKLYN